MDIEKMTPEEIKTELKRLQAKKEEGFELRVSEKGAVSWYGMRRFPITLYKEEWLAILEHAEELQSFIKANEAKLAGKRS